MRVQLEQFVGMPFERDDRIARAVLIAREANVTLPQLRHKDAEFVRWQRDVRAHRAPSAPPHRVSALSARTGTLRRRRWRCAGADARAVRAHAAARRQWRYQPKLDGFRGLLWRAPGGSVHGC